MPHRPRFAPLTRLRQVLLGGRWFFAPLAALYVTVAAAFFLVLLVDPYDLRPVGPSIPFDEDQHARTPVTMISVVAKNQPEIAIVGGSSSVGYRPRFLRKAFPGVQRASNLAIPAMNPIEMTLVVDRLLEHDRSLKRLILVLDWTLQNNDPGPGALPLDYYRGRRWSNPVPDFSRETFDSAVRYLRTGNTIPLPAPPANTRPNFGPLSQQPDRMAEIRRVVEQSRSNILQGSPIPCERLTGLNTSLIAKAREAAARGIEVEILTPPISLAAYADWRNGRRNFRVYDAYQRLMSLRRCVLEALDGQPGIRIHGLDTDLALTGDLDNYFDPGHMYYGEPFEYVLDHVAARDRLLTKESFPAYAATLAEQILAFDP